METESKGMDLLFNLLLIFAMYYLIMYVVIPLLYPTKSGCGCNKSKDGFMNAKDFDDSKFTPADKACLAMGDCTSKTPVPEIAVFVWKEKIMNNAEKIFGKGKSESKKSTPKKSRRK